ncbi:MAG TPA: S41 family peptidase [Chloroflexota bacterium]|nr:S41 family peptidase [Chloroflexota bacterium]
MRILVSLLVFLAVSLPTSASAETADCQVGSDSAQSLDVIQEAFDVLSVLFVERPTPDVLLPPAASAVYAALDPGAAADDEPTDSISNWDTFASQFCTVWAASPPPDAPDSVTYAAIEAMTSALNEGHTQFLTPEMYQDHLAWQSGDVHYEGIGARLASDPLHIQHVFPGSPAERAGIMFGDHILSIDGAPASDMAISDAVLRIRGEAGTPVVLTIARPGVADPFDVEIARDTIYVPTLESHMVGDIAYLHIDSFPTADLAPDVAQQLRAFKAQGAKGLILDLRDNSGGRLDVGTEIAGYFLPPGTPVYQQTTRRGQQTTATVSSGRIWDKPMDVLVNDGTASMGEILAAALQEGNHSTLIGTSTAGEVAGSIVVPLSDGSAIQVTTLRIDSGKGTILNNVGVQPDVEVAPTVDAARAGIDEQLNAALSHIESEVVASAALSETATPSPVPAASASPSPTTMELTTVPDQTPTSTAGQPTPTQSPTATPSQPTPSPSPTTPPPSQTTSPSLQHAPSPTPERKR